MRYLNEDNSGNERWYVLKVRLLALRLRAWLRLTSVLASGDLRSRMSGCPAVYDGGNVEHKLALGRASPAVAVVRTRLRPVA